MTTAGRRSRYVSAPLFRLICVWALLACILQAACSTQETEQSRVESIAGSTMGTTWSLSWIAPGKPDDVNASIIQLAIETELARINGLMSTWDPQSELSRFNQLSSIEPVALHHDTLDVIDAAQLISLKTQGRYDITLQPVIDLWGFNKNTNTPAPADADLQRARELSGYTNLVRVGETIRKRNAAVSLDVSSLAKGFAVDKLGEVAESLGLDRYIVDIGGEVRARGTRGDGKSWRVGIENPEGQVAQIIRLHDTHIATSGSYRNYRIENGKRLSHIIDGITGRPIEHDLVSVSVVHESTLLADVWATALLVVGEPAAKTLIDEQGLIAQLTVYRQGEFRRFTTAAFIDLVVGSDD